MRSVRPVGVRPRQLGCGVENHVRSDDRLCSRWILRKWTASPATEAVFPNSHSEHRGEWLLVSLAKAVVDHQVSGTIFSTVQASIPSVEK